MQIKPPNPNESQNYRAKSVSIDKKIEIFKRFFIENPTGEITGKTVFERYPIGIWAIEIRSLLKSTTKRTMKIKPSQLQELEDMGILESQRDTIDEKIQALVEWSLKYPMARIQHTVKNDAILRQYALNEEEFKKLSGEYEKLQKYYTYVRTHRRRIR